VSAYPLTIRTSRSRSTKSTAKVKGTLLQNYFLLRMTMYARSIAYVECGTPANAVAVKNWFDNK
jgi:hypothetical protein